MVQSRHFYQYVAFAFVLLGLGILWNTASAASSDFILNMSPLSPKPGETFSVTAQSFQFDTAEANFRWLLDGREIASGTGIARQSFTMGPRGDSGTIRAIATSADGDVYDANITASGNEIDIIVAPRTSVPALYPGAALPTSGSTVEINAVPHLFLNGSRLNHRNLFYEWSVDGEPVNEQSGKGRNRLIIKLASLGNVEHRVDLAVRSENGTASAQKSTRVKSASPEIVFYQRSALTGKKPIALFDFPARAGQSLSVIAEPYFFDLAILPNITGTWIANGRMVPREIGQDNRILQLAIPEDTSTYAALLFRFEDKTNVFQRARNNLTITAE